MVLSVADCLFISIDDMAIEKTLDTLVSNIVENEDMKILYYDK